MLTRGKSRRNESTHGLDAHAPPFSVGDVGYMKQAIYLYFTREKGELIGVECTLTSTVTADNFSGKQTDGNRVMVSVTVNKWCMKNGCCLG